MTFPGQAAAESNRLQQLLPLSEALQAMEDAGCQARTRLAGPPAILPLVFWCIWGICLRGINLCFFWISEETMKLVDMFFFSCWRNWWIWDESLSPWQPPAPETSRNIDWRSLCWAWIQHPSWMHQFTPQGEWTSGARRHSRGQPAKEI